MVIIISGSEKGSTTQEFYKKCFDTVGIQQSGLIDTKKAKRILSHFIHGGMWVSTTYQNRLLFLFGMSCL